MPRLILIKHSKPLVVPEIPSAKWELSEEGRGRCALLAERLRHHDPAVIVASEEPKARQTGEILAGHLGKPFRTAPDLHEHDRTNVPHLPSREFLSWMALFFQKPQQRVVGRESAAEALDRFSRAVEAVLAETPDGNVAIVTHGTVLALFVARRAGKNAFQLFRQMRLPSFVVLDWPEGKVLEIAEAMAEGAGE